MRHILVLLIGIVIGTLGAMSLSNAIAQRNPVPRAVMVMMAYHQGQLGRDLRDPRCSPAAVAPELQQLAATAANIPPVFQGFDQGFAQASANLQQRIQQASATQGPSCQALQAPMAAIKEACDACHRQYR
ncbi:cytochrome c [Frateuria aurantia]